MYIYVYIYIYIHNPSKIKKLKHVCVCAICTATIQAAAKKAKMCLTKCCSFSVRPCQSLASAAKSISSAVQKEASCFLYISKMPEYWMGSKTHRRALGFSSGSSFSNSLNLALTELTGTGTAPKASIAAEEWKQRTPADTRSLLWAKCLQSKVRHLSAFLIKATPDAFCSAEPWTMEVSSSY